MPQAPQHPPQRRCVRFAARGAALALVAIFGGGFASCALREAPRESQPIVAWERIERRLALMGTWLRISLEAPTRAEALAISEQVLRELEAAEARLSTWRDDSELARLNAAPLGAAHSLSPLLDRELEAARHWSAATNGAFDPALAPLVAAWSLRTGGKRPTPSALREAREASGLDQFSFAEDGVRRLHANAGFEEGAFGKGAGLDAALAAVEARVWRSLSVDLGGQLLEARHDELVERFVAHPRDRERRALSIRVPDGSLATSGDSERSVSIDGESLSHILDPRSGNPAPMRGTATVWARSALAADCLSTACYVLGPDAAFAFVEAREDVELVWLRADADDVIARVSSGLVERCRAISDDVRFSSSVSTAAMARRDAPHADSSDPQKLAH